MDATCHPLYTMLRGVANAVGSSARNDKPGRCLSAIAVTSPCGHRVRMCFQRLWGTTVVLCRNIVTFRNILPPPPHRVQLDATAVYHRDDSSKTVSLWPAGATPWFAVRGRSFSVIGALYDCTMHSKPCVGDLVRVGTRTPAAVMWACLALPCADEACRFMTQRPDLYVPTSPGSVEVLDFCKDGQSPMWMSNFTFTREQVNGLSAHLALAPTHHP